MSTLRRLVFGLVALGFVALPAALAAPAAAEPTPTPTAPPCKANSLKLTITSDMAVASAPDTWVAGTGRVQNTTGYYYSDITLTFEIWPDQGTPGNTPKFRFSGTSAATPPVTLRRVSTPHNGWRAVRLIPAKVWPTGIPSPFKIELAFPANSPVTTYSTRLTAVAGVCGDTVLASSSAMRFGFMTSGSASASAKPKPSASAKSSRKPSPTIEASEEEVLPPPDEISPEASDEAVTDQDLASGESDDGGSPLPWMAGLGITALFVAGGLLFWLRRTSYDEDD